MYTCAGTLYWRALRRVERRAKLNRPDLLREAVRTANRLFILAYGE